MIFADQSNLKEFASKIGMMSISQLSSIRCLSKMGVPLIGIISLKQMVDEIDCMLWSLTPLAIEHEKHSKEFVEQCQGLKQNVDRFIKAAIEMEKLCKEFAQTKTP